MTKQIDELMALADELLFSPSILRTRKRNALRTAIEAALKYPLPDDLYGSKDWKAGGYAQRVEWLHVMYESAKQEVERLEDALKPGEVGKKECPYCYHTGGVNCGDAKDEILANGGKLGACSNAQIYGTKVAAPLTQPASWPIDESIAGRIAEQHCLSYETVQLIARQLMTAPQAQTPCGYDETTGNCTSNPCCSAVPPAQTPPPVWSE